MKTTRLEAKSSNHRGDKGPSWRFPDKPLLPDGGQSLLNLQKTVKSLEIPLSADSLRAPWLALQEKPKPGEPSLNVLK